MPPPLIVREKPSPLSVMPLAGPKVNIPLLLTVRLSANTVGALMAWLPLATIIVAPLPELFQLSVFVPLPLNI